MTAAAMRLLVEADNLRKETGLTTRELAEQRAELLAALKECEARLCDLVSRLSAGTASEYDLDVAAMRMARAAIAKAESRASAIAGAGKRSDIIGGLIRIGHTPEAAERLLRRAEETADILAAREESGEPANPMDGEAERTAEDFEVFLPAVWEFVIAGHTGGGQG